MPLTRQQKPQQTKKEKFNQLIQLLRKNTELTQNQRSNNNKEENKQQTRFGSEQDFTPITQDQAEKQKKKKSRIHNVQFEIRERDSEDEEDSVDIVVNRRKCLLLPQKKMKEPTSENRNEEIQPQNTSINLHLNSKIKPKPNVRYHKSQTKSYLEPFSKKIQIFKTSIRDISDSELIKFWNRSYKIDSKSTETQIQRFFQKMMDELSIEVNSPMIQKYKNCVYFGQNSKQKIYQGLIYFFSGKIYYGQFMDQRKHGQGVEIDFINNAKYAGNFQKGSKCGFFLVQRQKQNYQGNLHYGLYHGHGILKTEHSIYIGSFNNNHKNGYGQQFFPSTGLKLQGYFKQGIYQHINKDIETINEKIPHKYHSQQLIKEKKKQGLEYRCDTRIELASKLLSQSRKFKESKSKFNPQTYKHQEQHLLNSRNKHSYFPSFHYTSELINPENTRKQMWNSHLKEFKLGSSSKYDNLYDSELPLTSRKHVSSALYKF